MDAQPKIGGFGCFKGVLQIPFFFLCNFTRKSFIFNPKMGIYDFLIGDPNIILFVFGCNEKDFFCVKKILKIQSSKMA